MGGQPSQAIQRRNGFKWLDLGMFYGPTTSRRNQYIMASSKLSTTVTQQIKQVQIFKDQTYNDDSNSLKEAQSILNTYPVPCWIDTALLSSVLDGAELDQQRKTKIKVFENLLIARRHLIPCEHSTAYTKIKKQVFAKKNSIYIHAKNYIKNKKQSSSHANFRYAPY